MPFVRDRSAGVLPTPVATFTDNFNRANEPLGASTHWKVRTGSADIDTNQLKAGSSALVAACTDDLGIDQRARLAAATGWSVCVRMTGAGTDRYEFGYDYDRFKIRKYVGGTIAATVNSGVVTAPAAPFTIELEVIAYQGKALLTGRLDGTTKVLMTDTSSVLAGTLAGVRCSISGAVADDFNAWAT